VKKERDKEIDFLEEDGMGIFLRERGSL